MKLKLTFSSELFLIHGEYFIPLFFLFLSLFLMTDYEKLEYIHFAIQEAINLLEDENPELNQALEFVESLRELYLS